MSEIDKLHARIRELEDEVTQLRTEAAATVYFWGQFASNYSKAHWDLDADVTRLRGPVPMEAVRCHPQSPLPPEAHRGALGGGTQAPAGRRGVGKVCP